MSSVHEIRYWHRQRQFAVEQRKRLNLAIGSFIRLMLGFRGDASEAERKEVRARADKIIAAVEAERKGKTHDCADPQLGEFRAIVAASIEARAPFDAIEREAEKNMRKLARTLPVYEWAAEQRGFGEMGLAQIVGEAGDLSDYGNPAKLWKRMGLAVMNGKRQGAPGQNASKADWIEHGYNPSRRSIMWNIGQSLMKANGPYAELIRERKEVERAKAEAEGLEVKPAAQIKAKEKDRCRSVGHVANRAQRYAEKRLLRDLWKAWRRAGIAETTRYDLPAAEDSGESRGLGAMVALPTEPPLPQAQPVPAE